MAKAKRNIGLEILQGIRDIKRGEHGRVTNVPSVSSILERMGLAEAIRRRETEEWLRRNRAAIEAYNEHVEKHGVFSEGLRSF